MTQPETISLYQFFQKFPDEESARLFFESKRWSDSPHCAHCGSTKFSECKNHKPMPYRCKDCRKHFSVRTGTILSESRLPLHKWLMTIYMMTNARKGLPSTQMAKELGTTQKTAWFLAQRIRKAWMSDDGDGDMGNSVQADETFVGGKEKNKHASKKLRVGRGSLGKTPVAGIMDQNGNVRAKPVSDVSGETLKGYIGQNVEKGSTVVTDTFPSYKGLKGYNHIAVNHSVGEYVKDQAHTNGIESFWALLKRAHCGIFHYISAKHLSRYVDEFSFRHNVSNSGTMDFINATVGKIDGKRLTYKELINA